MIIRESSLAGFQDDAEAALAASPAYFLTWYTIKSVGLVAVLTLGAYALGKAHGRR